MKADLCELINERCEYKIYTVIKTFFVFGYCKAVCDVKFR